VGSTERDTGMDYGWSNIVHGTVRKEAENCSTGSEDSVQDETWGV